MRPFIQIPVFCGIVTLFLAVSFPVYATDTVSRGNTDWKKSDILNLIEKSDNVLPQTSIPRNQDQPVILGRAGLSGTPGTGMRWSLSSRAGESSDSNKDIVGEQSGTSPLFMHHGSGSNTRELSSSKNASPQPASAFLRSVVFPGWGQRYGGRPLRGALFSVAEVGLWTGLFLSRQSGASLRKAYEGFAAQHAGVEVDHSSRYYVDIGNYTTLDDFNRAQLKRRNYEDQYIGASDWWQWDSDENRNRFKQMRIRSDRDFNRVYYFVGGLMLNRLLSGIEAARSISSRQGEGNSANGIHLGYDSRNNAAALIWRGWIGR